jgi:hypothetical protein
MSLIGDLFGEVNAQHFVSPSATGRSGLGKTRTSGRTRGT